MTENSKIEWADYTFNPWWGCQKVSPACEHCYAETFSKRVGFQIWGPPEHTPRRFFGEKHWAEPLKWNAKAEREATRPRVFCASMADVFEEGPMPQASEVDYARDRLWNLIQETPYLTWMLLTKRPENVLANVPPTWTQPGWYGRGPAWPANVWVGTTVESQQYADLRIPHLVKVPAPVRFISAEPLLGPLDLSKWLPSISCVPFGDAPWEGAPMIGRWYRFSDFEPEIQWVIVGGESGGPLYRSLVERCPRSYTIDEDEQTGDLVGPIRDIRPRGTQFGEPPILPCWPGCDWCNETGWAPRGIAAGSPPGEALDWVRDLKHQCLAAEIPFFFKQWGGHHPKTAGRLLDGREWNEFPQSAAVPA